MINSQAFVNLLKELGYNFFSGVPCSVYKCVIPILEKDRCLIYVPAPREDEAVAICSGATLAGKKTAVLIQNTGLGNCLDVLIGLNQNYHLPLLLIISWRGFKRKDEVQHWLWAEYQNKLLQSIKIPYFIMSEKNPEKDLQKASLLSIKTSLPVALIIVRGRLDEYK